MSEGVWKAFTLPLSQLAVLQTLSFWNLKILIEIAQLLQQNQSDSRALAIKLQPPKNPAGSSCKQVQV